MVKKKAGKGKDGKPLRNKFLVTTLLWDTPLVVTIMVHERFPVITSSAAAEKTRLTLYHTHIHNL